MIADPLSFRADDYERRALLKLPNKFEPHLFLDGDRFMEHLGDSYDYFDVMTYSMSMGLKPLAKINRLIYGLRQRTMLVQAAERRYMMNNHVKMFICYVKHEEFGVSHDVYVGSQNLTTGTNFNIMYLVNEEHDEYLISVFNEIWNQLKPQSPSTK